MNLLRKFTKIFKKDESGVRNREWKDYSVERIREIWTRYKDMIEGIIMTEFKYIRIPRTPLS